MLYVLAAAGEAWAKMTGKPALISMASVKLMVREAGRSHYNHAKTERELGVRFRPVEETMADVVAWYRRNGYLER
jgi:dihydroflavonol-4-reductase